MDWAWPTIGEGWQRGCNTAIVTKNKRCNARTKRIVDARQSPQAAISVAIDCVTSKFTIPDEMYGHSRPQARPQIVPK